MKKTVLSLFDGCGMARQAIKNLEWEVDKYYSSEIEKSPIEVAESNHKDIIKLGDVSNWREWDIDWSSIDVLIGGSPCQGFSRNGKMLNFDDPRSKLFFEYVDILNHIKTYNSDIKFLLENVKMKKEHSDVINEYLGTEFIEINSGLLSAQKRPRCYWTNIEVEQPKDMNILLSSVLEGKVDDKYYNLREDEKNLFSFIDGELRVRQATKKGYAIAEIGDSINISNPKSKTRRGRVGKQKTNTLDTSCNQCVYVHKSELDDERGCLVFGEGVIRRLTPLECERLQGLPDHYTKGLSDGKRYKMLGNGFTVPVISHLLKNTDKS